MAILHKKYRGKMTPVAQYELPSATQTTGANQ
jgi:hypothetical protein